MKQENECNLGKYDKVGAAVGLVSWTLEASGLSLNCCCHMENPVKIISLLFYLSSVIHLVISTQTTKTTTTKRIANSCFEGADA